MRERGRPEQDGGTGGGGAGLAVLVRADDPGAVSREVARLGVPAAVDELERLDRGARATAVRALDARTGTAVLAALDPPLQAELLRALPDPVGAGLALRLDPDDRARLLAGLPDDVAERLLAGLPEDERRMTVALAGHPLDSAGRRMSPEVVALPDGWDVGRALDHVRREGAAAETVYMLPVVDDARVVVGVVALRRLVLTPDEVALREVMSRPVVVRADDDQEVAARTVRDHGLLAAPVVDDGGRLLGVLTVDDAMRVLEEEVDEDSARGGGSEPLRRPYLATSVPRLVRARVVWLLVLLVGAGLTVGVLGAFEATLAQVVTLSLFVPLLIGTGGNAGAQAVTTVVRALSVGDVRPSDVGRVVVREAATGLLLGTSLALVGAVPATLVAGPDVALVLCLSLVVVCTLATTVGSVVPVVATRVGVDPAVVSSPFITTVVDATGLVVYFLVAQAVLGL